MNGYMWRFIMLRMYFYDFISYHYSLVEETYHYRETYITFVKLLNSLCDFVHNILSTMYSEIFASV